MTKKEAKEFLVNISYNMGTTGIEDYTCKDGDKMIEAIKILDKMTTKRISVTEFLKDFSKIDDINYQNKIIVFSEGYSDEEYDAIYDLLHNKWKVNKLRYLNRLDGCNRSGIIYDTYDDNHELIKRQLILVENCDLEVIDDAYDLWEYLDMDYELYLVCHAKEE